MKLLDRIKEKFISKKVEIKVGTRVRVDEDMYPMYLASDLLGMEWGTVVEVDKEMGGYLVKPDNCNVPNNMLAGWVSEEAITEAVNL